MFVSWSVVVNVANTVFDFRHLKKQRQECTIFMKQIPLVCVYRRLEIESTIVIVSTGVTLVHSIDAIYLQ